MSELQKCVFKVVNVDELLKDAYVAAYERPLTLTAEGGVHASSMPRVRAFAGNSDRGHGTYTDSQKVGVESFPHKDRTHYSRIETQMLVDKVARAMCAGTKDKIEDRDKQPSRAL